MINSIRAGVRHAVYTNIHNNSISAGVLHDVYTLAMCTSVFINKSTSAGEQHAVYTLGVCTHVFLINSISSGVQPAMYTDSSSVLCFKQVGLPTCTVRICRGHSSDQSIIVDARNQSGHNCLTMTKCDS